MMKNAIELKINKQAVNTRCTTLQLKHSLMYSLFASTTSIDNIVAEIERIELDIQKMEGMLTTEVSQIILLCQSSNDEVDFYERTASKFKLQPFQAEYIVNLDIRELTTLNYEMIKTQLEKSILFLNTLLP